MSTPHQKLYDLLGSMPSQTIEKLVDLSNGMRTLRPPRPRAADYRFVLCDAQVLTTIAQAANQGEIPAAYADFGQPIRVRMAVPVTMTAEDLAEKTRLELYCEDGSRLLSVIALSKLSYAIISAITDEMWQEIAYYADQT